MSELPPSVARLVADATEFAAGMTRAKASTSELQAKVEQASLAARKMGVSMDAAAQTASTAAKRAMDAAAGLAAAQDKAAAAAERLARGEISAEEAATAEAAALKAAAAASDLQARSALAAERASIKQADAAAAVAKTAKTSAAAQEVGSASTVAALNKVGKTSALIGLGVAAVSVKMAGDFEQQTNVLVTAAGESQNNLGKVRDGILAIASSTGTSWQQVTAGVYVAEKAGYRGAEALQVVKASAQGAREEQANLATVLNATTSVMASYHLKASDAVTVTNQIKTAAGETKATMEEFAGSLSTVLPIASAAGISFAQVAGSLATLTQHGTTTNEATQELAGTIKALANPTNVAVNEMAQLGLSSVDVQTNLGKRGLSGTLELLSNTVLQKMGPAGTLLLSTFNSSKVAAADAQTEMNALPAAAQKVAQAYANGSITLKEYRTDLKGLTGPQASLAQQFVTTENKAQGFQSTLRAGGSDAQTYIGAIAKMTGGTTGLNTLLQLTGGSAAGLTERINAVSDASKNAGNDVSGWASTQKLFNVQFDQFKQQAAAVAIHLGQDLIPPIESILRLLTAHPAVLKAAVDGVLLFGAAWGVLKIAGWIDSLTMLATRTLAVGTAAGTAAAEVEAASLGTGAAAGAGAAGAAGAGIKARAASLIIPVVVTYVALKSLGLEKATKDLLNGDLRNATKDSPKWVNSVANSIFGPGSAPSGPLTGVLAGKLADPLVPGLGQARTDIADIKKRMLDLLNTGQSGSPAYAKLVSQLGDLNIKQAELSKQPFLVAQTKAADVFHAALTGLGGQLISGTHGLAANSEAARGNQAAIVNLIGKAKDAALAVEKQTGSTKEYTATATLAVGQIDAEAAALGLNVGKVDALARSILGLPPDKAVPFSTPGLAESLTALAEYNRQLALVPQSIITQVTQMYGSAAPTSANDPRISGHKAAGGYISGPGTGTSDSIPLMGSNGEFMVNAKQTAKNRPVLEAINSGADFPRFAQGGPVGYAAGGHVTHPRLNAAEKRYLAALNFSQHTTPSTAAFLNTMAHYSGLASKQDTINAYTADRYAKGLTTAADVPRMEAAGQTATSDYQQALAYFNAHQAALVKTFTSKTASGAKKAAARAVYNQLQSNVSHLHDDASAETTLARTMRAQYAGPEASVLNRGRATRDWGYLAVHQGAAAAAPMTAHITVVSQLDGRVLGAAVSSQQLATNLRNGYVTTTPQIGIGGQR
jgi:TP901 family phage tail tape measure protein